MHENAAKASFKTLICCCGREVDIEASKLKSGFLSKVAWVQNDLGLLSSFLSGGKILQKMKLSVGWS